MSESPPVQTAPPPASRRGGKMRWLFGLLVLLGLYFGGFRVYRLYRDFSAFTLRIRMEDAAGLGAGSPVRIAGVKAGRVHAVTFGPGPTDPGRLYPILEVKVRSELAAPLRSDLAARVDTALVFGENALEITPGTPQGRPLLENDLVDLVLPESEQGVWAKAKRGLRSLVGEGERSRLAPEVQVLLDEIERLRARVERLERTVQAMERAEPRLP